MRCSFHQQDVQMSCGRNRYSSSSDKSGNAWCIQRFPLHCSPRQRQTMNAHPYHDNVSSRKCSSKLSALAQNRLSDSCICFSDGLETSDRTLCHKYVFINFHIYKVNLAAFHGLKTPQINMQHPFGHRRLAHNESCAVAFGQCRHYGTK